MEQLQLHDQAFTITKWTYDDTGFYSGQSSYRLAEYQYNVHATASQVRYFTLHSNGYVCLFSQKLDCAITHLLPLKYSLQTNFHTTCMHVCLANQLDLIPGSSCHHGQAGLSHSVQQVGQLNYIVQQDKLTLHLHSSHIHITISFSL